MCGIAGIYRRDGAPASAEDAGRMARAMSHRGPDGHGAVSDGPLALGHVRLAIRDLSPAASQPMAGPGGAGLLAYNGEVYNDADLRAALAREGAAFRGTGDSEVVLHALARWGVEAALPRLDGMFAFAWWDARARVLWLARDRFGIKPLHVAVTPERLAFASEIRGLRALPGVAREPDPMEVVRRLLAVTVDEIRPPFLGVENVAPGEVWRVEGRTVERRRWHDPAAAVDAERLRATRREGRAAHEARIAAALEDSVARHLASDVPLAAFTSGGVDSNLVAAIARDTRPDLRAYTADTGGEGNEAPDAEALARHLGMEIRRVRCDRESYLRAWPASVEALEHPTCNPSHVCALLVARAARADGVAVAITGEGADEWFGGYDFLERTWRRWRRAGRWWSRLHRQGRALRKRLAEAPFDYQTAREDRALHRRVTATVLPEEESRPHALLARLEGVEPPEDRAFLAHSLDALHRHLGWILLRHDRLCMAASLEARVPFLSAGVADVALRTPVPWRLRGRTGKWILKRVAARRLPRAHVFAKKRGYPVPADHHRGAEALLRRGALADLFRWTAAAEAEIVPRVAADAYLRQQAATMEIWARIFLRGERADAVADALLSGS